MDRPTLHTDSPLLMAALLAPNLSPIVKEEPASMDFSTLQNATPVPMDLKPPGAQAPQLGMEKLWILQQAIAAILPYIHLIPGPEKILVTQGLSALTTQAPDFLKALLPIIEAAGKVAKNPENKDMETFLNFVNDSRN